MCTLYYAVTIQVVIVKKSRISQSNKAKQSARDADVMFLALINTRTVQPVATCRYRHMSTKAKFHYSIWS